MNGTEVLPVKLEGDEMTTNFYNFFLFACALNGEWGKVDYPGP